MKSSGYTKRFLLLVSFFLLFSCLPDRDKSSASEVSKKDVGYFILSFDSSQVGAVYDIVMDGKLDNTFALVEGSSQEVLVEAPISDEDRTMEIRIYLDSEPEFSEGVFLWNTDPAATVILEPSPEKSNPEKIIFKAQKDDGIKHLGVERIPPLKKKSSVSAKRKAPDKVPAVEYKGLLYEVIHFGIDAGVDQNGGLIGVRKKENEGYIKIINIYTSENDPHLERDVQDDFIKKMRLDKKRGILKVETEGGHLYFLDLETNKVTRE